jgi:hypothetical protein
VPVFWTDGLLKEPIFLADAPSEADKSPTELSVARLMS